MSERSKKAKESFLEGYNCAQCIALAFCDLVEVDEKTLLKLASPFGGGMGRMRQVCGAVSGMYMMLGLLEGYDTPDTGIKKKELYEKVQHLAKEFTKENGSILCNKLLGDKGKDTSPVPDARTEEYYKKRPCASIIESAAALFEEYLKDVKQDASC